MKERKLNTCNGNCVLRAELKKQAEKEQKEQNSLKEKSESIYTITNNEFKISNVSTFEVNKEFIFYNSAKPNSVSFAFFHPPSV